LDSVFVDSLNSYRAVNLSEQEIIVPEKYKVSEPAETSENTVEDNNNNYLY
jgi:hypothetical protein